MLELFKNHIQNQLSFLSKGKLLIAISGGIDSTVLTHLCHQVGLNMALAHCNFNLRDKESDEDEAFVMQLGTQLDLEVFVQHFDTMEYAEQYKCSIQMAARELRYNWFNELSERLEFDYVLTAHHADDNLETFLINLTRGTGLDGLTGIPVVNDIFVRPLLPFSSHDILTFAQEQKIKWREDSSNKSVKYLRNKLRHEVIPVLKEINPSLLQSFKSTLSNLKATDNIVEQNINTFLNGAIEVIDENQIVYNISEFKKLDNPKAYLYQVFKDYGFSEWNDVENLLNAETGKQVHSSTHRLIKNRKHLLLSKIKEETNQTFMVLENEASIHTSFGTLFFEDAETISDKQPSVIFVDKDRLEYPLIIRKYVQGDVFYPLGMRGKKKISKFFKDEKLSLLDKENTWLLCSGNDIVWVVNRRADNRFKVTENTKSILKIELK